MTVDTVTTYKLETVTLDNYSTKQIFLEGDVVVDATKLFGKTANKDCYVKKTKYHSTYFGIDYLKEYNYYEIVK